MVAMVVTVALDTEAEISIVIASGDHLPKLTKCAGTEASRFERSHSGQLTASDTSRAYGVDLQGGQTR